MGSGQPSVDEERSEGGERSTAALFAILWDALADLLGTAATATLVRRAAQRATRRCPELGELVITRKNLDYGYDPPPRWKERKGGPPLALRELFSELRPLLVDLTGAVVINHLARIPELREHGLIPAPEELS
jgi:hypothetical protein